MNKRQFFIATSLLVCMSLSAYSQAVGSNLIYNVKGVQFEMVKVQGGNFQMGTTQEQDKEAGSDEMPQHMVILKSFYICSTEVTQELWEAVMDENPSYFKGAKLPVEEISWNNCKDFLDKLYNLTGKRFRLPTEAEWEYASRGGNLSKGYLYSGSNNLSEVAWYKDNSEGHSHPVATKKANELGLYDMSGNVFEWCSDWYLWSYYRGGTMIYPQGPKGGVFRVRRSGCFDSVPHSCRNTYRYSSSPESGGFGMGLRIAMSE